MTDCVTCGALPDSLSANTGRSESLPAAVGQLKRLWNTSGSNDTDAMLCLTCGAWFEWRDETAWTGSDELRSRALGRMSDSTFETMLPALVERFFTTPNDLENHALYGLLRRVETRAPLRARYLALASASTHPLPARAKYLGELCEAETRKDREGAQR